MTGAVEKDQTAAARMPSPEASARRAGLHYVSDDEPGIRRKKWGRGFTYLDPEGRHITDEEERARIEALAIPPAWTDVWICLSPKCHLQATGRDDRGRKQYRYHPKWEAVRKLMRFDRLIPFGQLLSPLRARCAHDLAREGLPRDKVLAAVVRLLDCTLIRIGHDEYADANDSFGLATLRRRHVSFSAGACTFTFTGKSGQDRQIELCDPQLIEIIQACCDVPGYEIFTFFDEEGTKHDAKARHVNAYLKEITGAEITAKDFRPWHGTVAAAQSLCKMPAPDSDEEVDQHLVQMVKEVAERLGNTVAVCREHYIHPAVFEGYHDGSLCTQWPHFLKESPTPQLAPEEHALLRFLEAVSD